MKSSFSQAGIGSKKYVDTIEQTHSGHFHELFRYVQKVRCSKATYQELSDEINSKSAAPPES